VCLNVYDLNATGGREFVTGINKYSENLGIGAFHSGVAVEGVGEWGYGFTEKGTGVFRCSIRKCMPERCKFRKTVALGETNKSAYDIYMLVQNFAKTQEWQGKNYDLTRRNCNHFSNALAVALVGTEIPTWVNRGAESLDIIRTGVEYTAEKINAFSNSETLNIMKNCASDIYSRNHDVLANVFTNISNSVSTLYSSCLEPSKEDRDDCAMQQCELEEKGGGLRQNSGYSSMNGGRLRE